MSDNLQQDSGAAGSSGATDTRYYMIVAALLVTIIVLLAMLWQKERRARLGVEAQWSADAAQNEKKLQVVGQMLVSKQMEGMPAVTREDLPSTMMEFQGRRHSVFNISAAAGRKIGFVEGDIIVVGQASPSVTATRPAESRPAADAAATTVPASPATTEDVAASPADTQPSAAPAPR